MSLGGRSPPKSGGGSCWICFRESGRVDISGAAGQLGVDHMTIRRDLKGLEREGSARLVRGGAIFTGHRGIRDPPVQGAERQAADCRETRAARARARLRRDRRLYDLLFRFAEDLPAVDHLVVVTYGIPAFQALQSRSGVRAFLSGGELDRRTGSLVGRWLSGRSRLLPVRRFLSGPRSTRSWARWSRPSRRSR